MGSPPPLLQRWNSNSYIYLFTVLHLVELIVRIQVNFNLREANIVSVSASTIGHTVWTLCSLLFDYHRSTNINVFVVDSTAPYTSKPGSSQIPVRHRVKSIYSTTSILTPQPPSDSPSELPARCSAHDRGCECPEQP